jgi:hypothetical protein
LILKDSLWSLKFRLSLFERDCRYFIRHSGGSRNPGKYVELETRLEEGIDRKENPLWQDLNETISPLDSGFRRNDGVVVISVDEWERS